MGSGKTTWTVNNLLNQNLNENILYITPYLDEVKRIKNATEAKKIMYYHQLGARITTTKKNLSRYRKIFTIIAEILLEPTANT